jgi:hypothetical protein
MSRTIDHVTFAGTDLGPLRAAFEHVGFEPEYGGVHSNGITHMALVGFEDQSYVELISKTEESVDETSPWWDEQIDSGAGATAWAVPSEEIDEETERIAAGGLPVDGPKQFHRERPDGDRVEWELTRVGEGPQGSTYPMLIMDHTPLERRVTVTADAETTGLAGLQTAVLGTTSEKSDRYIEGFETVFDTDRSGTVEHPSFGARITHFDDAPVGVATPLDDDSWLADRVGTHGTLPCAHLLAPADRDVALERFDVAETTGWTGDVVHWFDISVGGKIGVLDGT